MFFGVYGITSLLNANHSPNRAAHLLQFFHVLQVEGNVEERQEGVDKLKLQIKNRLVMLKFKADDKTARKQVAETTTNKTKPAVQWHSISKQPDLHAWQARREK